MHAADLVQRDHVYLVPHVQRYIALSSFTDLVRIVYAVLDTVSRISVRILQVYNPDFHMTDITFAAILFLNIFLMIFSRIVVKEVYEAITGSGVKPVNVFVYGTKEAGSSVAKALKGNSEFNYRVLGFISDEGHMVKELMSVTIYANNENLFRILESKDVKTIIVSPQKMEVKNSNLLANFVDHNISLITTVPLNGEWHHHQPEQLKDVQIEDLPRDPIHINMLEIASNIEGEASAVTVPQVLSERDRSPGG